MTRNSTLPGLSTDEERLDINGASTCQKLPRRDRPTNRYTDRCQNFPAAAEHGLSNALDGDALAAPESYLKQAPMRQMRRGSAIKLFSPDTTVAAPNTRIVSDGAGPLRHLAAKGRSGSPTPPPRRSEVKRRLMLDSCQLDYPPPRSPVARLHHVQIPVRVHPDPVAGLQFGPPQRASRSPSKVTMLVWPELCSGIYTASSSST